VTFRMKLKSAVGVTERVEGRKSQAAKEGEGKEGGEGRSEASPIQHSLT